MNSHLFLVILSLQIAILSAEAALKRHEYEGLSIRHNLRFPMSAGTHLCFYQEVQSGNHLRINVKTLNGDGRFLGVQFQSPTNLTLVELSFQEDLEYKEVANETGIYEVCLSNPNVYSTTIVNLLFYAFDIAKFTAYFSALASQEISVVHLQGGFGKIQTNLVDLKYKMEERSQHETEDLAKAVSYQQHVDLQSFGLCVLVLLCGIAQVTALKKMFGRKVWTDSIFDRSQQ